jgi:plastocyanin
MDRRAFLATGASATLAALAGCGVSGSDTEGNYDVGMTASRFDPGTVTVAAGDTVRWKNTSSHAHTVTAYGDGLPEGAAFFATGGFESQSAAEDGWIGGSEGALYEGDTYEHSFEVPGTYNYYCIPHEASGMVGVVEVTEGTTTG